MFVQECTSVCYSCMSWLGDNHSYVAMYTQLHTGSRGRGLAYPTTLLNSVIQTVSHTKERPFHHSTMSCNTRIHLSTGRNTSLISCLRAFLHTNLTGVAIEQGIITNWCENVTKENSRNTDNNLLKPKPVLCTCMCVLYMYVHACVGAYDTLIFVLVHTHTVGTTHYVLIHDVHFTHG